MTNYLLQEHNGNSKMPANVKQKFTCIRKSTFASTLADFRDESVLVAESHEAIRRVFSSLQESFFKKQANLRN